MKHLVFYFLLLATFVVFFTSQALAQNPSSTLYDVNKNCAQDPNGGYATLEDCFRALNSSLPAEPIDPNAPTSSVCEVFDGVYLDTCDVSEKIPTVKVTFIGYREDPVGKYFCYKTKQEECNDEDDFKVIKSGSLQGGIISETVCGDGENNLKGTSHKGCDTNPNDGNDDYFWQGKVYRLGLYTKKNKATKLAQASFFIKHSYPRVEILPKNPGPIEGGAISINISGLKRVGKKDNGDKQNNYQIILEGRDIAYGPEHMCAVVKEESSPAKVTSPSTSAGNLPQFSGLKRGKYLLKILEQNSEKGDFGSGTACAGGFAFYYAPITVGTKEHPGKIGELIQDPNQQESSDELQRLEPPPPPCLTGDRTNDGRCIAVTTALGKINVMPEQFVGSLFKIFLSAASVSGFMIFLYAGYKILTSGGNKEKVGEAREQIKAVILGILFIVISLVILETLGVDILKIPGFSR